MAMRAVRVEVAARPIFERIFAGRIRQPGRVRRQLGQRRREHADVIERRELIRQPVRRAVDRIPVELRGLEPVAGAIREHRNGRRRSVGNGIQFCQRRRRESEGTSRPQLAARIAAHLKGAA